MRYFRVSGDVDNRPQNGLWGNAWGFSHVASLVPEDVNGVLDAYQYDPAAGVPNLLSSGRGDDPAGFADASISGDDTFILTRQRLDGHDGDDLVDVYDVRKGRRVLVVKSSSPPAGASPVDGKVNLGLGPRPKA